MSTAEATNTDTSEKQTKTKQNKIVVFKTQNTLAWNILWSWTSPHSLVPQYYCMYNAFFLPSWSWFGLSTVIRTTIRKHNSPFSGMYTLQPSYITNSVELCHQSGGFSQQFGGDVTNLVELVTIPAEFVTSVMELRHQCSRVCHQSGGVCHQSGGVCHQSGGVCHRSGGGMSPIQHRVLSADMDLECCRACPTDNHYKFSSLNFHRTLVCNPFQMVSPSLKALTMIFKL